MIMLVKEKQMFMAQLQEIATRLNNKLMSRERGCKALELWREETYTCRRNAEFEWSKRLKPFLNLIEY